MAKVKPERHHLNKTKVLNIRDKFLIFLGGGLQTHEATQHASFVDVEEKGAFFSSGFVILERMPLLLQFHEYPAAAFINGRILVNGDKFECFTPTCMSPWSPKQGQWSFVEFNNDPDRNYGSPMCLNGTFYFTGNLIRKLFVTAVFVHNANSHEAAKAHIRNRPKPITKHLRARRTHTHAFCFQILGHFIELKGVRRRRVPMTLLAYWMDPFY